MKKAKEDVIFVGVQRAVKTALEESAPLELAKFEKDSIEFWEILFELTKIFMLHTLYFVMVCEMLGKLIGSSYSYSSLSHLYSTFIYLFFYIDVEQDTRISIHILKYREIFLFISFSRSTSYFYIETD